MPVKLPNFPPPALVERTLELGFGSGPWTRRDLAQRWGKSVANKFIDDAKNAGWLAAPLVNTFYVPPARDLMIVNWLNGQARDEFIISRMLAAAGFRSWCLSAWARAVGIETRDALFVTDLGPLPRPSDGPFKIARAPPPRAIADRNSNLLEQMGTLPFLENVILVPFMPQSDARGEETSVQVSSGQTKTVTAPNWILDAPSIAPPGANSPPVPPAFPGIDPSRIRYPLTPVVDDVAWVLALVAALGLPRFNERLKDLVRRAARRQRRRGRGVPFTARVRNWAGLFAPPEPNTGWRTVFQSGRPQYLLVPSRLLDEAASLTNAQRFRDLAALG